MSRKNSRARLERIARRKEKRYRQWGLEPKTHSPKGYNKHHRLPKSRHGSNSPSNISIVPITEHHAYNELFGSNPTAREVVETLNAKWIDPAWEIHFTAIPKGGVSCRESAGSANSTPTAPPTSPAPPAETSTPSWSVLAEPSSPVKPRLVWSSSRHYLRLRK